MLSNVPYKELSVLVARVTHRIVRHILQLPARCNKTERAVFYLARVTVVLLFLATVILGVLFLRWIDHLDQIEPPREKSQRSFKR